MAGKALMAGVAITNLGVVAPCGVGVEPFLAWWREGRPSLAGPVERVTEPWLPIDRSAEVRGWRGRAWLPDRKAIKLMTPRVQFGLAAALQAWSGVEDEPEPALRGMYVGCGVPVDEDWTFREAIEVSIDEDGFHMERFANEGQDRLNPLWLVKGLTNNVMAFAAKELVIQGPNDNFEGGAAGPLLALESAVDAVERGKATVAIAGGSDSLVATDTLLALQRHGSVGDVEAPMLPAEGAAFVRLEPGRSGQFGVLAAVSGFAPPDPETPRVGAWPPSSAEAGLDRLTAEAWRALSARYADVGREGDAEAVLSGGPALRMRGPRLPTPAGALDLWASLGDPGAAAGALLLAAAWAARVADDVEGVIELSAAGENGQLAVVLLGPLP